MELAGNHKKMFWKIKILIDLNSGVPLSTTIPSFILYNKKTNRSYMILTPRLNNIRYF